ncbi:hypothetical protein [Pseudogulbenkiania sp. MAI-1]|uniref:hypothetical protein n=1 Tax=Pseudogulbenkiania sp. MAI-1 TaxID=990370 RepID=UPI0012EB4D0A|nr:hypothetical protein [Pseudogulbenkiania sp. MAI-1]
MIIIIDLLAGDFIAIHGRNLDNPCRYPGSTRLFLLESGAPAAMVKTTAQPDEDESSPPP